MGSGASAAFFSVAIQAADEKELSASLAGLGAENRTRLLSALSSSAKADMSLDGQVFFIAGFPSSGKTFMGDYLASRGWEHVDGDLIANPEAKAMGSEEKVTAFWAAMQKVFKGGNVERVEWVPYYDLLIELTKKSSRDEKRYCSHVCCVGDFRWGERALQEALPQYEVYQR